MITVDIEKIPLQQVNTRQHQQPGTEQGEAEAEEKLVKFQVSLARLVTALATIFAGPARDASFLPWCIFYPRLRHISEIADLQAGTLRASRGKRHAHEDNSAEALAPLRSLFAENQAV